MGWGPVRRKVRCFSLIKVMSNLTILSLIFFKRMFIFEGIRKDSDLIIIPLETRVKNSNIISYGVFYFTSIKPTIAHDYVAWKLRFRGWGCSSVVQDLSSQLSALPSSIPGVAKKQKPTAPRQVPTNFQRFILTLHLAVCKQKPHWLRRLSHSVEKAIFPQR